MSQRTDAYRQVLSFWFEEIDSKCWWAKDHALDQKIRQQFSGLLERARQGELFAWRSGATGRLADWPTGRDHRAGPVLAQYPS
jgi:uncharacterized protein (DUF924 family)